MNKEELENIVDLIISLRPHPGMLQRACYLLGSYYRVVNLDGLPCDPGSRQETVSAARHDRAWLHRTIDHELTVSSRTITGFYSHLVERGELWRISTE